MSAKRAAVRCGGCGSSIGAGALFQSEQAAKEQGWEKQSQGWRCSECLAKQQIPIGALAITPFPPRGLVRVGEPAGVFHGRQMVAVEYVQGVVGTGYTGCHYADSLTMVPTGHDAFCRVCGATWTSQGEEVCPMASCGSLMIATIPSEVSDG